VNVVIQKSEVNGWVEVPSSKSVLQRYIIAALLADGLTELSHVIHCEDSRSCLSAVQMLGAKAKEVSNGMLQVEGNSGKIIPVAKPVSCNESGFALRALTSIASLSENEITLTGTGSLVRRPIDFFETVFPQLKVKCTTQHGFPPVKIQGPVQCRNISMNGSLSSQFLSGLLMIYPLADGDHQIDVHDLKSRKYIDLTIGVLNKFGVEVMHDSYRSFFIKGGQRYKSCQAEVEGDWSAASFMLVAGAIAGSISISNLNMESLQPDKAIIDVLRGAGADVQTGDSSVTVQRKKLTSFTMDASGCPDLIPPLVTLAVNCNGTSEITGVERLIHKESNRALALQQEFSRLNGEVISIEGNKMIIRGGLTLQKATVESHNDHRIAMALAIAGLNVRGGIQISGSESVKKSYPGFFTALRKAITKTYE
jgi:3-phosphoshikimate 1-carboxyvinyltransferase